MGGEKYYTFLERPHWESTVYINGKKAGTGISLATPHEFEIQNFLIWEESDFYTYR